MNCVRCNMPLEAGARFCRNCGLPVSLQNNGNAGSVNPSPLAQQVSRNNDAPTIPPMSWQAPDPNATVPSSPSPFLSPTQPVQPNQFPPSGPNWQPAPPQQQAWTPPPSSSSPNYRSQEAVGTMRSGNKARKQAQPKRRRGRGCLISSLVAIVLVVALLVAGRLIVNNLVISQMNQTISDAINNIPAAVSVLPGGTSQTITETQVNNLITNHASASDPVQNVTVHLTSNNMQINFNVYNFSSTITTVPQIQNGKLVATNTTVQGLASLILSSDDITNLINTQINNLQTHIQHTITAVTLENQAIQLTFSSGSTIPGGVPGLP
ncbi:MAG TPA: zinc ribbon domain-containing protein [Ktedonobacteraceae bacterium]|nr:zinc ribbon domain-containing protein [Ktedonobacteraceae bacterium]